MSLIRRTNKQTNKPNEHWSYEYFRGKWKRSL